mmetsp:Transcript_35509/g.82622  ORF Transcript_35509/g.82622 Transcript_35509/m.82622 type:complete len:138 (-) Transcript_35509:96-509(-)
MPSAPQKRYVQIGRVCLINYGEDRGKLVTVVNILDGSRVLVDGPTSGVQRQVYNVARLGLTPIKIDIPRNARIGTLTKAITAANVDKQWANTAWAKKIALRQTRRNMSDFDRFKVMVAKKTLHKTARAAFNKDKSKK